MTHTWEGERVAKGGTPSRGWDGFGVLGERDQGAVVGVIGEELPGAQEGLPRVPFLMIAEGIVDQNEGSVRAPLDFMERGPVSGVVFPSRSGGSSPRGCGSRSARWWPR